MRESFESRGGLPTPLDPGDRPAASWNTGGLPAVPPGDPTPWDAANMPATPGQMTPWDAGIPGGTARRETDVTPWAGSAVPGVPAEGHPPAVPPAPPYGDDAGPPFNNTRLDVGPTIAAREATASPYDVAPSYETGSSPYNTDSSYDTGPSAYDTGSVSYGADASYGGGDDTGPPFNNTRLDVGPTLGARDAAAAPYDAGASAYDAGSAYGAGDDTGPPFNNTRLDVGPTLAGRDAGGGSYGARDVAESPLGTRDTGTHPFAAVDDPGPASGTNGAGPPFNNTRLDVGPTLAAREAAAAPYDTGDRERPQRVAGTPSGGASGPPFNDTRLDVGRTLGARDGTAAPYGTAASAPVSPERAGAGPAAGTPGPGTHPFDAVADAGPAFGGRDGGASSGTGEMRTVPPPGANEPPLQGPADGLGLPTPADRAAVDDADTLYPLSGARRRRALENETGPHYLRDDDTGPRSPVDDDGPRYPLGDDAPRYPIDDDAPRYPRSDDAPRYPLDDDDTRSASPLDDDGPRYPMGDGLSARFPPNDLGPRFPPDDDPRFARDDEPVARFSLGDDTGTRYAPGDDTGSRRAVRDDGPRYPLDDDGPRYPLRTDERPRYPLGADEGPRFRPRDDDDEVRSSFFDDDEDEGGMRYPGIRPSTGDGTGRRSGKSLRTPIAAAIIVAALVGGIILYGALHGSKPQSQISGTSGAPAPAAPQSADATQAVATQAVAVNAILQSGTDSHDKLAVAMSTCDDLATAVPVFQQVVQDRAGELTRSRQVQVDQLPRGAELRAGMIDAYTNAVAADRAYLAWAQEVKAKNCGKADAPHTPRYAAALAANAKARTAKDRVVSLWTPIAQQQSLPVYTWNQL